jgi:hypothetical protein
MSKRIQVLIPDDEDRIMRRAAKKLGLTLSEWVRQALRAAAREGSTGSADRKLAAIRSAARHEFPTADIEVMHDEIERGYRGR